MNLIEFLIRRFKGRRMESVESVEGADKGDKFVFVELPEEEKVVVVEEIFERWKDMVYMNAKGRIRQVFERGVNVPSTLYTEDEINLSICLCLVVGDIVQVLGRYRRKKSGVQTGCGKCGWKPYPGAIIPCGPGPMDKAQWRCPGCGETMEANETIEQPNSRVPNDE